MQERQKRGAIDFETTETYIVCNPQGKIEEIIPRTRNDAHRLIEECMLAALIPLAVFVLGHLGGWTLGHLAGVLFGGVLLTGLYLVTRDLVACMIAHALIDTSIIFLPALLRRYGNPPATAKPIRPEVTDVSN